MEEGPTRTDLTVTNGMAMANEKILRSCMCGCMKTTTLRGLRVHQGKKKCPRDDQRQPCTAPKADETRRAQSQVEHHSAVEPTVADGHTPSALPDTISLVNFQAAERIPATEDGRKEKHPCRKKKILLKTQRFGES